MILIIPSLLIFMWVLFIGFLLLGLKNNNTIKRKLNLGRYFGYHQVSNEAKDIGWNISSKEFFGIVIFAIILGAGIAVIFRNPLIILAGILGGYYLPRILIQRFKKRQRMALMDSIPDFGRILIARLLDYHSIVKAVEVSQNDIKGPMKIVAHEFIKDIGVGIGIELALEKMKSKISYRKFNTFAETLLIAHQEGYSNEALKAMEKAIEAIENDINAIEALHITTRKKKRELIYVVLAAWAFPLVLSFMNTNNVNVFLDTLAGKFLMFSYIISTLVVLIKGEDYLSLKLEEL